MRLSVNLTAELVMMHICVECKLYENSFEHLFHLYSYQGCSELNSSSCVSSEIVSKVFLPFQGITLGCGVEETKSRALRSL